MSEALQQWDFVVAAYAIGGMGTTLLIGWAVIAMRRAEHLRDKARKR